jgi:transcriptional regulator with GAF, ATPase, and Fis domain
MKAIASIIEQVSDNDVTVLIRGESGVGKELVARAIHQRSPRKDRPFVKVNCAALPAELLESELFGHEKGAFTGAATTRIGKFEQADTGTIFLDEIGEMKAALQAKLLHVLQDAQFTKLGSNKPINVDVRVVAATNQVLEAMMLRGEFREDLYYRLKVIEANAASKSRISASTSWIATLVATIGSRASCPPSCSSSSKRTSGRATSASSRT